MASKNDYSKLYEEYKDVYKQDRAKAKELNSNFDMPMPETWDRDSVRLRAFLDRDSKFYVTTLSPFEFYLKKQFTNDTQAAYEALVFIYRDEYFSYNDASVSYGFVLNDENELISLAQEYTLEQDKELMKQYLYPWQKKLDVLKSENIKIENITLLRMQEKLLLQEYENSFSVLVSLTNKYAKALKTLLLEYSSVEINSDEYTLQTYFNHMFDLSDEVDLIEYIKTQELLKSVNVVSDITQIRVLIQKQISDNNKEAELAQCGATHETMGELLLEYASFEQEIVTQYRTLVSKYLSYLSVQGNFLLINEPFEVYFDNYFADFENTLNYYKLFYKEIQKSLTETPYYMKMYNATQAKISILNLNIQEAMHETKKAYISKRSHLTDLKIIQREYSQEFDILLGEFTRYGEMYIKEIKSNEADLKEHKVNIAELQERFDLREEYGFF
ncbi:hypothetical protein JHD46_00630 [Sulfurimonas sp. SAG-AH-194-C20]|nr:hypothetical protein [Sulfurimonas sp. SAG-AH-194-C20]MDF1878137.1 hypothetical protein [Sulfurimonas sp. SAG-AH-194-C20]